jgi:hypothetical protein
MPHHDHVDKTAADQAFIGNQLARAPRVRDIDDARMGIVAGGAVAWKVFGYGQDSRLLVSVDEFAGIFDDLVRVGAEASPKAADCRVGRIEVEIDDRPEVDVESEIGELPRGRRIELIGFSRLRPEIRAAPGKPANPLTLLKR